MRTPQALFVEQGRNIRLRGVGELPRQVQTRSQRRVQKANLIGNGRWIELENQPLGAEIVGGERIVDGETRAFGGQVAGRRK